MKEQPKRLPWIIGSVVTIFAVLVLITINKKWQEDATDIEQHSAYLASQGLSLEVPKDPRFARPPARAAIEPEIIEKFVRDSDNSPEATSLAFVMTGDMRYIEYLKSHSDSEVALQLLAQFDGGCESKLFWAEQLNERYPNNGMGKLLAARALDMCGDRDAALSLFSEVSKMDNIESQISTLQPNLKDLLSRVPPSKKTEAIIRDVMLAQATSSMYIFPDRYDDFFKGRTIEQARDIALIILGSLEKLSGSSLVLMEVEGLTSISDVGLSIRVSILNDFEKIHERGSSNQIDTVGFDELLRRNSETGRQRQRLRYQLTPEQIDQKAQGALDNL